MFWVGEDNKLAKVEPLGEGRWEIKPHGRYVRLRLINDDGTEDERAGANLAADEAISVAEAFIRLANHLLDQQDQRE